MLVFIFFLGGGGEGGALCISMKEANFEVTSCK